MHTPEVNPDAKPKPPAIPSLVFGAITWALIGGVLWALGVLTISFAWIIGPLAYLAHLNLVHAMVKRIVSDEMEKVIDSLDLDDIHAEYGVVTYQDATGLEGALN